MPGTLSRLACLTILLACLVQPADGDPPAGFQNETLIASGLSFPTALEFLPDGRMLITQFAGKVVMVQSGAAVVDSTPVLQLVNVINELVTGGGERGLVNVLADPGFSSNGFIYLFYTAGSPQRDRVSRFTMTGNTASLASEVVIWQGVKNSTGQSHHGGGMVFGSDGKLYISTGDNDDPQSSQSLTSDHGKLLRINANGTVPTDNPFYDGTGSNIDAIWARGLRNPFRLSLDAPTGRIHIGDVGFNATEEVNVAVRGANYGWPNAEGPSGNAGLTNPIYSYPHEGRDAAVMGGFVYRGAQFPTSYQGVYFFADYAQNRIRYLTLNASGSVTGNVNFEPQDGSVDDDSVGDPVVLKPGPDGAIYYVDVGLSWSWSGGGVGPQHPASVRRIRYTATNQPPVVNLSANPTAGSEPLVVAFSSSGSADPEGLPLTYAWTFGDGATSTQANPTHMYTEAGAYLARLAVSDGVNTTHSGVIGISVGNAPTGTISGPATGARFRAGDVIAFSGTATDVEDGTLPASAFSWNVLFHHGTHAHPALGPLSGVTSGSFNVPTSGHTFGDDTSYEILMTVTDSDGLQKVTSVVVLPEIVTLAFATVPSGLTLSVDGIDHVTPFFEQGLVGFQLGLTAPDQPNGSHQFDFVSWSDEGPRSHTITVPDTHTFYSATYGSSPGPPPVGLVAGYNFDAGTGTTLIDWSGTGNTGTLSGPTWTTMGKNGNALAFDGVNDLVTVADSPSLDLTTGMTLEAWIYPTVNNGVRDVLIKEGSNMDIYNLYCRNGRGLPEGNVRVGSSNRVAEGSALPINAWTHLSTTYDGAVLRLFTNGTQVASTTIAGAITTSTGALRVGGNSLWGEYFQGRIDDLRIYNRALSAAEIQTDMNRPVGNPTPNTPPTISDIASQTTNEDTAIAGIAFTVGDSETAAGSLTLSGVSSNTTLVPNAAITFEGSGANRVVTVTPAANQAGTLIITVGVSDGGMSTTRSFVLTVNPANDTPTVTAIADQVISVDGATGALPFTVGDPETAAANLTVSANSSNPALVPNANIILGGSGANRTVTVTPVGAQTGSATIVVSIYDGSLAASSSFLLTVSEFVTGTVTFTNAAAITIPASGAAAPYPSSVNVAGMGGLVTNVTVTLRNIGHTNPDDLDVLLVGPAQQKVLLMSDAGGTGDLTNVTLTLADAAAGSLSNSGQLASGTFKPSNFDTTSDALPAPAPAAPFATTLSTLNGANANGTWTLYVRDDASSNQGSLAGGWSLTVTTALPPPQAPTLSDIADQVTAINTATAAIPFTVGDADTPIATLVVSGTSSNATLLANANIVFGGTGANRTLTLTPTAGQTGTTTVTVSASDGALSATDTFVLSVAAPAGPGLVAAYNFDEGTGTTLTDISGTGNTGTVSGPTWSTLGKTGNALAFDGVNDLVTVADSASLDLTTGMTLEAWIYPTVNSGVRDVMIKEGSGMDVYNLYCRNWRGLPEGNVRVGSTNRTAEGTALPINSWTHLGTTYDGAVLRLFVNGTQVASTTIAGSITTSTGSLRIGGNSLWGEYFQGRIDDLRIYNRALSAAEIQLDLNTPVTGGSALARRRPEPPAGAVGEPSLAFSGQLSAGATTLQIEIPTGTSVTLEASGDLIDWTELATFDDPGQPVSFTDEETPAPRQRFYRLRVNQTPPATDP